MEGLCPLRRRATACEKNAAVIGANTRLAMRNAENEIQVFFRKYKETAASADPPTNHQKHLAVRLSACKADWAGQSKGHQLMISMRNSKRNCNNATSKSSMV